MFKEGDRVICVNNPNAKIECKGAGWKSDFIFTIYKISGTGIKQILWPGKDSEGIYNEHADHASWKNRYGDKK